MYEERKNLDSPLSNKEKESSQRNSGLTGDDQ